MSTDLRINRRLSIPLREIMMDAVRAQGAGGQHVNKTSSAIHLRFDIHASSLPEAVRQRLVAYADQRVSSDGVIVIKVQDHRSQERNRLLALQRLAALVRDATHTRKARRPTRPSLAAKRRRVDAKKQRGQRKALRGKVTD